MVSIEVISDQRCRSVSTMSCTECIIYIAVCIRSQSLCEFFLAFFNGFLGSFLFIVCCVFSQTSWFAFFFRIETKVFQQQCFARLQCSSLSAGFFTDTVVSKLNFYAQQFRNVFQDMFQRIFICNAFRTAQV